MTMQHHDTHLATTQATVTTTQYWTATEAAHILNDAYGYEALNFTPSQIKRKLADAIAQRVRHYNPNEQVVHLRQLIIEQDQIELPPITYDGPQHINEVSALTNGDTEPDSAGILDDETWEPMESVTEAKAKK